MHTILNGHFGIPSVRAPKVEALPWALHAACNDPPPCIGIGATSV